MLKALAVIFGLFIIITRGLGVLNPARLKSVAIAFASNARALRWTGAILLVFSVSVFLALGNDLSGARVVMAIVGTVMSIRGILLVLFPARYEAMVKWFVNIPDPLVRFLSVFGVAIGFLILWLALAYY